MSRQTPGIVYLFLFVLFLCFPFILILLLVFVVKFLKENNKKIKENQKMV